MSLTPEGTLDTNILLRFILSDDAAQHRKAKSLIEQPKLWRVSLLAIAEIVFILEGKGFTRAEAKQNIDAISSYPNLYIARAIIGPAMELYAAHPALSFIDACLVYEATVEHAAPLMTFDKKLANQAPSAKLVV